MTGYQEEVYLLALNTYLFSSLIIPCLKLFRFCIIGKGLIISFLLKLALGDIFLQGPKSKGFVVLICRRWGYKLFVVYDIFIHLVVSWNSHRPLISPLVVVQVNYYLAIVSLTHRTSISHVRILNLYFWLHGSKYVLVQNRLQVFHMFIFIKYELR